MSRGPIALGSDSGRSKPINAARLLNLYAEKAPAGSMAEWVLLGTPGQKTWTTAGIANVRAGRYALGYTYALSGSTLYRIDSSGAATACTGASIPSGGRAQMVDNGTQLGLLVNNQMFYVTGTTVTLVADPDFPTEGATSIDYIDGYGVFSRGGNNGQWFLSGLFDFSTYAALDFATAQSSPDALKRVLASHKEVWLFGDQTTEVWQLTGASPFPFQQIPGSLMDRGIAAPMSALRMDNSVFWIGDDRIVYRADGYTPVRISTHALEEAIRTGVIDDAFAMTHSLGGHHFYVLTFPTLGRTFSYDAATQLWHERQTGTGLTNAVWSVNCIWDAYGKTLAGSSNGKIVELDLDTYTDNDGGTYIRRAVTSAPLYNGGNRGIMRFLELECELGVGLQTGQGSDPKAMLRWSKDGGQTFGNEKWASFNAIGVRRPRCKWLNLGLFRDGVAEISVSDPIKIAVYGARYESEGLAN